MNKMSVTRNLKNEIGFTLIEVLIALALLAIGLLMAANLQTTAIAGNKGSSSMNVATLLGQQAIEQLLTYSSGIDASLTSGTHTAATEAGNHATLIPNTTFNGIVYTRSYVVTPNTPISGVRTVVMTIQWTDKTSHLVTLVERMVP
jgi:prepilin-type N-terminal cleavage/methylation domain-containing protein